MGPGRSHESVHCPAPQLAYSPPSTEAATEQRHLSRQRVVARTIQQPAKRATHTKTTTADTTAAVSTTPQLAKAWGSTVRLLEDRVNFNFSEESSVLTLFRLVIGTILNK